ncbi:MAG TPA: hypothetical protein PKO15_09060 [Fibrobacteria bacterium]|nr:hypothetical protein [Fibrobacteria bacterium]HOX50890.1 hypothetical protein [Fibrobacteria bacterium]
MRRSESTEGNSIEARDVSSEGSWARGPGRNAAASGQGWLEALDDWHPGRIWWVRLPLLGYMVWLFVHHVNDPMYQSLLKGLDLGVHELGHILFSPFGEFLSIAGGTISQCALPLVGMAMFLRQRDLFAIAFGLAWLGVNFHDVAVYAADARAMELPLVSPFAGDEIGHDWNLMLERTGLLEKDQSIGWMFHAAGHLFLLAGILLGAWTLWRMRRVNAGPDPTGTPGPPFRAW